MDEKQYIYGRLHFLTEQIEHLTKLLERQQELIGGLVNVVEQMHSPEYASKQAKVAEMVDVAEKIKFIRSQFKK